MKVEKVVSKTEKDTTSQRRTNSLNLTVKRSKK